MPFFRAPTAVPDGRPEDVLRSEVAVATQVLGIKPDRLRVLDFEMQRFARSGKSSCREPSRSGRFTLATGPLD